MAIRTLGELRLTVAGFMGRDPAVFLRGVDTDDQIDLLTTACNNARLFAERQIDFEGSKVAVDVPVTILTGGTLDNAVLHSDGVTAVRVKKIRTPFLPFNGNANYPVDLISKKSWDNRIKSRFEGIRPVDSVNRTLTTNAPFAVVQDGSTIYITPPDVIAFGSGTVTVYLDVIQWLDDYTDVDQSDFLLDFAFDWLMYRAIYELNFFLKEDESVQISDKLITTAWNAVVTWNRELVEANVDDTDLD